MISKQIAKFTNELLLIDNAAYIGGRSIDLVIRRKDFDEFHNVLKTMGYVLYPDEFSDNVDIHNQVFKISW